MSALAPAHLTCLHRAAQLTRVQVWRGEPPYHPTVRQQCAAYPRIGHIGKAHGRGGSMPVGANGNSTEGQDPETVAQRCGAQDGRHVKAIGTLRRTGSAARLASLTEIEGRDRLGWHMGWIIKGSLDRLTCTMNDLVICNVIPFLMRDAPPASSPAWKNAMDLYFAAFVKLLAPRRIVWMGKAADQRSTPYFETRPAPAEAIISRQRSLPLEKRFAPFDRSLERRS